jgi:NADPH:quinone reductase-like Zn-dependent oxidoreductase
LKAVAIQAFGGPEGLAVIDVPDPSPGSGQVLIATEAIGVGGVGVLIRSGAVAAYGFKEGHIPGSEIAGTVAARDHDGPARGARWRQRGGGHHVIGRARRSPA